MSAGGIEEWLSAIAARAEASPEAVEGVLAKHAIRPSIAPPRPRALRIERIAFSGTKIIHGAETPFAFAWDLGPGLWCVASHDNLVGKSTVLHLVLWALRGEPPRGLQADVRSWIRSFAVGMRIDDERLTVEVALPNGEAKGRVRRLNLDGSTTELGTFETARAFSETMAALMMERLGLEPIPYRMKFPGSDDGRTVFAAWPAYAMSLYFGDRHELLLGDNPHGNLPGRMLEMFVGVSWAATSFAAQAAKTQNEQELRNAERRAKEDRAQRLAGLEMLEQELAAARAHLETFADVAEVSRDLDRTVAEIGALSVAATDLAAQEAQATDVVETARRAWTAWRKRLREIEEAQAAQQYFQLLQPRFCPRCHRGIADADYAREHAEHACSVCAGPMPEGDPADFQAELETTRANEAEARQVLAEATTAATDVRARLKAAHDALARARARVAELNAQASRAAERHAAERRVIELQARLADRRQLIDAGRSDPDRAESRILAAAAAETDRRARAAEATLFDALNEQIIDLAKRFGVAAVERARIDRSARLKVWKGGAAAMNYGDLTPGERVRLRLATVIALLRVGQRLGLGRHPGLVLVDSPGSEETREGDVAALLGEINALTTELPHLQVLVASAQPEIVTRAVDPARLRLAGPGETLW